MTTRVMLADNKPVTDAQLERHLQEAEYLIGQPKIDGMRVLFNDDCVPTSRSGKEYKQKHIRHWGMNYPGLRGKDGEVVPGHIYTEDSFRQGMSGLRAEEGSAEFTFYVFDDIEMAEYRYCAREKTIERLIGEMGQFQSIETGYHAQIKQIESTELRTLEEIWAFEARCIAEGWEGAMLRRPDLAYKFGRSTNGQGHLIKLKRAVDAEAIVVGYEPWEQNQNEPTESPLGYTVRSAHQENKVALERLGAWKVELLSDRSVEFKVGVMMGVTHQMRDQMWIDRDKYIGRIMKFKHQGYGGGYDKPRQPVFLNWRLAEEF